MTTDYGLAISRTYSPDYQKDPSDVIDYSVSWHHLSTDTIVTSVWESEGLTIDSSSTDGLTAIVFVSGGSAGAVYRLKNTITTGMGRTLERSVFIGVSDL